MLILLLVEKKRPIMKLLLAISVLLVLQGNKVQPIEILQATGREIVGGRKESGTKWYYTIMVRTFRSSRKLQFNKVWIGKTAGIPEIWDADKSSEIRQFSKGDSVLLILTMLVPGNNTDPVAAHAENRDSPGYKGAGLIEITLKKKTLYREISRIDIYEPLYLR